MKRAKVRQEVFASPGYSVQNNARGRKKPGGQFKSIKGAPVRTRKDVLQWGRHYVKVVLLTNSTFLSPKFQAELSCGGALTKKKNISKKIQL